MDYLTRYLISLFGRFRSLRRFPVPVAISIAFAIVMNNVAIARYYIDTTILSEVAFALFATLLTTLTFDLLAEARPLDKKKYFAIAMASAVAIAALQMSHGRLWTQDLVVVGSLSLFLLAGLFLSRAVNRNDALWNFDFKFGIAVTAGLAAFVITSGGLSLLLVSFGYLFDLKIPESLHNHIWITGISLVAPLFAIAMIPEELQESFVPDTRTDLIESAIAALVSHVLAPLILAYALMLHFYAVKIAIIWAVTKGEIGRLVSAFGAIGTTAYMISYPWREVGNRAVRWFVTSWFWLMVIPVALLVIAVCKRVDQYGVTPERYYLCLFAVWMAAMTVYLGVMRSRIELRVVPASLGVLLLLSSVGPWGAVSVSVRSQLRQLQENLESHHLLADGRLKLTPARLEGFNEVSAKDSSLRSILKELYDLDALGRLQPLFSTLENSPFTNLSGIALFGALKLNPGPPGLPQPPPMPAIVPLEIKLPEYGRILGPIWISSEGLSGEYSCSGNPRQLQLLTARANLAGNVLTIDDKGLAVSFEVHQSNAEKAQSLNQPTLLTAREGGDRAMLLLLSPPDFEKECSIEAWLLLGHR